jgi:DNA mismatch endonuclease (patch repair protein)
MTDVFSAAKRSQVMSRIKGRGNVATELLLIKIFRKYRITGWRRHLPLFGKPDFVFPRRHLAVFVDGCFWHGCSVHRTIPVSNNAFWKAKIERNRKRDRSVTRQLRTSGWTVLRVWQHDLKYPERVALRIKNALSSTPRANGVKIFSAPPWNCSKEQLTAFENLVLKGGEVTHRNLRSRIMMAHSLVFLLDNGSAVLGVAALKRPHENYKAKVFRKAESTNNHRSFNYEIGWMFIEKRGRGNGYSKLLFESVMEAAVNEPLYLTTRVDNTAMRRTCERFGFVKSGVSYQSDSGPGMLVLYVREVKGQPQLLSA